MTFPPALASSLSLSSLDEALSLWRSKCEPELIEQAQSEKALEFLCAALPLMRKAMPERDCRFGVIARQSFDEQEELIDEHPGSRFCALVGDASFDPLGSEARERWEEQWWDEPGTRTHFEMLHFSAASDFFEYLRAKELPSELDHKLCSAISQQLLVCINGIAASVK